MKKQEKGITLVALIITIIILIILAAVTIIAVSESNLVGIATKGTENYATSQVNETQKLDELETFLEEAVSNITATAGGMAGDTTEEEKTVNWTQSKTSVTNGTVTLEVGQQVSGYTGNGVGDGNWYVLGAENGKLLITTTHEETIELNNLNEISKLNAMAAKYNDGNMAETARSIHAEDINRITGYNPDAAKFGAGTLEEYGNKVTYTLNEDGYIHYQGTKYPTTDTKSDMTKFYYWNGNDLKMLTKGESITITNDAYSYELPTFLTTSSKAYNLLFGSYWLNLPSTCAGDGSIDGCQYGVLAMEGYEVVPWTFGCSVEGWYGETSRARPAISLKSNVKVTNNGELSI